jgi:hypothetical protein
MGTGGNVPDFPDISYNATLERSGVDIIGVGEKYEEQRWGAHTKSVTTQETDSGEIRTDVWPW